MNPFSELITPALISILITAFLAPLLFYLLKRGDDKRKRNFEVRYAEYMRYLKTLDEIATLSRFEFEQFYTQTIAKTFRSILSDSEDSDAALIEMSNSLVEFTTRLQKIISKAEGELHGLRLICSDELLRLIDEYVELQRELLTESTKMMENWRNIDINKPESAISGRVKAKGERSQEIYRLIVDKMRKELRIR